MTGISADPYWWKAAPPQDFDVDHWPERADVVIIGGGYTGFGAAIPLAHAGLDVVILERDQIGSGASTRNGGITSGNLTSNDNKFYYMAGTSSLTSKKLGLDKLDYSTEKTLITDIIEVV